ncbi:MULTISPECIES: hypothetical protein [Calothrix]|uniref:Uncharacterized protein n=2 Tax=Calothrix TaxID=1186 RepID=A0ABR8AIZ3_9CYAN|nr:MULTISPECIES: hypothetical protein [Calothrix]MBD2199938.1 hypothetical protein [Calothrix parietina FACHB-288]MBD2228853.1 hypothetical protein [Calothrix anomala FACHB-343]
MLNIKESILSREPEANLSTLSELMHLVDKYNLKWVPSNQGNGAYFIMSQLSEAKGLDKEDYLKNWANLTGSVENNSSESTTSLLQRSSESLAGKAFKLEGEELRNFKDNYFQVTGESLGRINSLWVGDWLHGYAYLVQGNSEAAKDFQSLGAEAIKKGVDRELPPIDNVDRKLLYNSGWKKEADLQIALSYLASYTPFKLTSEFPVEDYSDSKTEVRRFDLFRVQPHKTKRSIIYCFELKKDIIDYYDLIDAIEAKRYVQLLKDRFTTKEIKMYLVAPFGGTGAALEKAQEYPEVEIWTVQKMALFLKEKVKAYHPKDKYFVDNILCEMDIIKKLLTLPSLPSKNIIPLNGKKVA